MKDIMLQGVMVAVIGIVTVFAVLAILWGVIELSRMVFYKGTEKKPETVLPEKKPAEIIPPVSNKQADGELIAVLTAAIAASLSVSTDRLHIKAYRRIRNARF